MSGFKITHGRGFHITFENGWTVSVQFGPGNYADNREFPVSLECDIEAGERGSTTAECAVWGPDGNMVEYNDWNDTVGGWMEPSSVLKLLNWTIAQ